MKKEKIINSVLEMIFPPSLYCLCCGNIIDKSRTYSLCDHCMSHMEWNGFEEKENDGMKVMWCVRYSLYSKRMIFGLKYNGKKYISREIARIMKDKLDLEESEFDVIVPVPVSAEREKQRGFNQVALIGKYLGKLTGKECIPYALLRTRDTRPMRGLNPEERKENIKGTIALNRKYGKMLKDKRILLIDDFYTTGSTSGECRKELMKAEPEDILFLSFAAK